MDRNSLKKILTIKNIQGVPQSKIEAVFQVSEMAEMAS